jgi:hypothetical protein
MECISGVIMAIEMKRSIQAGQETTIRVYREDSAVAPLLFERIGLGYLSKHQQYTYMLKAIAQANGVDLSQLGGGADGEQ